MPVDLLPSAVQVRIYAPKKENSNTKVKSWSMPAWVMVMKSPSVMWGIGETDHDTVINSRFANEMGICDGDEVEFEFVDNIGLRFKVDVTVLERAPAAFMINGITGTRIMEQSRFQYDAHRGVETLTFNGSEILRTEMQSFWYGMRQEGPRTSGAVLHFDGVSRNNPNGPSGYGFCIHKSSESGKVTNTLLLQGYGYAPAGGSNNRMEYAGLLGGLWWALLLHVKTLWIRGDSELVINQVNGQYQVNDRNLQDCHNQVELLVDRAENKGIRCIFEHVRRENNQRADSLANLGTDLKENAIAVNWGNCNKL